MLRNVGVRITLLDKILESETHLALSTICSRNNWRY